MIESITVRLARAADIEHILRIDRGTIGDKRDFLIESVKRRYMRVAEYSGHIVGYVVWDRSFFSHAFIWLLAVEVSHRRRGIATALLHAVERDCAGEKLFTSTENGNDAMHELLAQLHYIPCGAIAKLNPVEEEIFYVRLPSD